MKQLTDAQIGKHTTIEGQRITCRKTYEKFCCVMCHFKEKGPHCPQGKEKPLCFASERLDNKSVYFPQIKGV